MHQLKIRQRNSSFLIPIYNIKLRNVNVEVRRGTPLEGPLILVENFGVVKSCFNTGLGISCVLPRKVLSLLALLHALQAATILYGSNTGPPFDLGTR